MTKATKEYERLPLDQVLEILEVKEEGLGQEEYEKRVKEYGLNEVEEKKKNPVLQFLKRFWGPMPWLLEITIILNLVIKKYVEAVVVFSLLLINAIIGFVQSQNSRKAVELLKLQLEVQCQVLRNGEWTMVDSKTLVPGDIVKYKLGDLIPADGYVIEGEMNLDVSMLTGESLPKQVNKGEVVYSGSVVKRGGAKVVIVNTALNTYFGKTVSLVQIAKPKSKQQEIMFKIVRYMMYLGIAASLVLTVYALILKKDIVSIFSLIIIFLMSAVPVALPAVMTIIQSVGATKLSKKGVLVTRLDAVEDAASIDVFCFDKTGTITQNVLSVKDGYAMGSYSLDDLFTFGALASNLAEFDAIDKAIIDEANKKSDLLGKYEQLKYLPFNPENKRTEATIKDSNGNNSRVVKGSPQIIAALCEGLSNSNKDEFFKAVDEFSKKGHRSIAVAISKNNNDSFEMVGVIALADPIREDSREMISKIKEAGIKPIMLTGDNLAIAKEIAKEANIGDNIYPISVFNEASEEERMKIIDSSDGFAEVYPENKFEIIRILQKEGHVVGMTGDGVNDSPALKQAELGVAVDKATDVARASASAVLTKPGLGEILDTIEISRGTFQRIMTWVMNKITKVVEVVILFLVGYFVFQDMVISLLGMTLLVFANDFVTISIATDNVIPSTKPDTWNMKGLIISSLVFGLLFALEDILIAFIATRFFNCTLEQLQTVMMFALVINTQMRIFIVRERRHFWSSMPSKILIIVSIITILLFVPMVIFDFIVPAISIYVVLATIGVALGAMLIIDSIKRILFKTLKV